MKSFVLASTALAFLSVPAFAATGPLRPNAPPGAPAATRQYMPMPLFGPRAVKGKFHTTTIPSGRVGTSTTTAVSVMRAADFINTIGVNLHISQGTANFPDYALDTAEMNYIGARHARDNFNNWTGWAADYEGLVKGTGFDWDFIFATGGDWSPTTMAQFFTGTSTTEGVDQIALAAPGGVGPIEGVNEINNFHITWTPTGGTQEANSTPTADDLQKALYSYVHSDPNLVGSPVYYFTGYCCGYTTGPNPYTTSGLADFDTQHAYPGSNGFPMGWMNLPTAYPNEGPTYGTAVETETGYQTPATSDQDKTDYTLDILADDAVQGVARTYFYALQDEWWPNSAGVETPDGWGLFNTDTTGAKTAAATTAAQNAALAVTLAKPVAVGMHNLITILADSGVTASTFTATPLVTVTKSTLPSTATMLPIMKSSGEEDLTVWNESTTPVTGTLTFSAPVATAAVYDPLVGTSPTATSSNVSSVNVTLGDHPIIVELTGTGTAPVAPTFTVSPADTQVNGATGSITDTNGNVWTIDANGQIDENGTAIASSKGVVTLFWTGTALDQLNSVGDWWPQPLDGSAGAAKIAVAPTGYVAPTPPVVTPPVVTPPVVTPPVVTPPVVTPPVVTPPVVTPPVVTPPVVTPPVVTPPAPTVVATTLPQSVYTIYLSEDAYKGDAEALITVDGKVVVTNLPVTAIHGSNQLDAFTFVGNYGAGNHTIKVTFLNDLYAGTAATDRNLYFDHVEVDGVDYGSAASLDSTGSSIGVPVTSLH